MIENQQPANAKGPDICPGERDVDDALVARTIAVANARWARQAPNALRVRSRKAGSKLQVTQHF